MDIMRHTPQRDMSIISFWTGEELSKVSGETSDAQSVVPLFSAIPPTDNMSRPDLELLHGPT
eukprot:5540888-Amphidinium_carterae.2